MRATFSYSALAAALIASCGFSDEGTAPRIEQDAPDADSDVATMPLSDAAADADAAPDADASTLPSEPGRIACGAASCVPRTTRCCIDGTGEACRPFNGSCTGTELNCDEKADCLGADLCCLGRDNAYPTWSTYCRPSCSGQEARVCTSAGDCVSGTPCLAVTCGTRTLGTCGGVKVSPGCP